MNKPYRFMLEYASFQKKSIMSANCALNIGIKEEFVRRIDQYIRMYEKGFITVDECMRLLSFQDSDEDLSSFMR